MTDKPSEASDETATPQREVLRGADGEIIETVALTPAEEAARKQRNRAIALALVAFIGLIFLVTVVRLSSNMAAGG